MYFISGRREDKDGCRSLAHQRAGPKYTLHVEHLFSDRIEYCLLIDRYLKYLSPEYQDLG